MMKHIYTSIDIGSDTIKVVVCELYQNKLNLLASSSVKSKGIRKGLIVDIDLAKQSVSKAIKQVEDMLGIRIRRVITSVPSFNAEYSVIKGSIKIASEDNIIRSNDIMRVLESAMKTNQFTSREIVTVLPVDYMIDDKNIIKNPKGLKASILGCRAVLVTTPKKNVYSVIGLLESLGLEVVDISLNNIGDIYSFNNKEFEEKIGAIINIGSDITNVSLYNKGILVKSSIVNMGGTSIDEDISSSYKLDLATSRQLKLKFALAHKRNASVNDIVEIKESSNGHLKINQFEISEVVMHRISEILEETRKEINLLTSKKIDYIIITGGTSNMVGFEYVVNDIFGENASIGNVKMLGIRNNIYSSCIGNIIYFINKLKLKDQNYSMINDNEAYQMASITSKKFNINTSDSMLGKIFGFFFSE